MTVIVTRKPGGVTQLFNTETGRVTYKCKAESAYMLIEAFGGIIKFHHKEHLQLLQVILLRLNHVMYLRKDIQITRRLCLQSFQHTKNLPKMFLIHIKKRFRNLKTSYLAFNF